MKQIFKSGRLLLTALLMMLLSGNLFAQKIQVSGNVTDADTKETLIGVTIVEKGTTNGTTTDVSGAFRISVPKGAVLVFSYVGYNAQELSAQEVMNVSLVTKQTMLDQVVVVGYGTQNRRDVTGSIYKVKGNELASTPVPSFEAGLQGRAPGVSVIQSSGMAGAGSSIKIRGVGSINSGGEPLYVIDGVILPQNSGERIGAVNTNPLNTINADDIESIDILKDASATAIYGSRGANGVIIITTKKAKFSNITGVKPVPVFSASYRTTLSTPTQLYDLLNTEEYVKLYVEAFENDKRFGVANGAASMPDNPNVPLLYGGFDPRVLASEGYPTTDWQKEMTRVGVGHAVDASMSYGTKKLATYFSIGYHDDESYVKENSFRLFSSRFNLDYQVSKQLKVGMNASFSHSVNHLVPVSWNGGLGKAMSTALPYWPVYNQTDPSVFFDFPQAWNGSYNPVKELGNRTVRERFNRTISNAYLNWEIKKNLNLNLDGGIDNYNRLFDEYFNVVLEPLGPRASQTSSTPLTLMGKALLTYDYDLNKDNKFKFLVGEEVLSNQTKYNTTKNVTYLAGEDGGPFYKDPTIADTLINSKLYTEKKDYTGMMYGFVSFFGRVNYALKNKYFVNASYRRDGSSRFGPNHKWGSFPAVSIGWLITEEKFMKDIKGLTYLKLKAGYGKSGNAEIPNDAQWAAMSNETKTYMGQPIKYISALPNPDLRWETSQSVDAGVEFGLFNDRINGSIEYYYKQTNDLFLKAKVQSSSGWKDVLINIGELWNKGVEISLNSSNIKTKNFSWNTNFNIAFNANEVTNTGHAGPDAFASTGDVRVLVGYPVGVNYLVKELGVDPQTGAPIYEGITKDEKGNIISRFKTFTYSTDYRQPLGKPWPDWIGGLTNNFSYKRFDMSLMFNFQIGGSIYDDSEKYQWNAIGNWNLRKDVLDRWQVPGDNTDVPRMTLDADVPNRNTTRYLHDASYLRLKNLSVGYTFKPNMIHGISKLRLALTGTNLLTWTKYPGMDPEIFRDMENVQQRNLSANVTYLTPPQARTFSLSINVEF